MRYFAESWSLNQLDHPITVIKMMSGTELGKENH